MHPVPKKGQVIRAAARFKKTASELMTLAQDYAHIYGLVPHIARKQEISQEREEEVEKEVDQMHPEDAQAFNHLLAMYAFGSDDADLSSVIAAARQ
jgi:hypothetical protein